MVLAAGAIKTPQLLLLSGIGPGGPVVDAPRVGQGLQDHPLCIMEWSTPDTPNLWEEATPENLARWQRDGDGPFASSGAETVAFARSRDDAPAPDLLLGPLPGPAPDGGLGMPDRRGVGSLVMALDVRSRGSVTLRSPDPLAAPAIDPGYLAERHDLDALEAGIRLTREIVGCDPLAGLTAGERAPGEEPAAGVDPRHRLDRLPPRVLVLDGRLGRCGVRPGPAGPRRRRAVGRRRLRDAEAAARQHQRADDRDRRACRRPDACLSNSLPCLFELNVPNVLTVFRILLIPVLVAALLSEFSSDALAAGVFILASLTDALDGWLARRHKSESNFGKLMDPLADKLLVTSALVSLVALDRLQAWVAMVIIAREFAVTGLRQLAIEQGHVIAAASWGKVKTVLQIAMVLALIAVDGSPAWVDALVYVTVPSPSTRAPTTSSGSAR